MHNRIAEIRMRLEAVTPGPWEWWGGDVAVMVFHPQDGGRYRDTIASIYRRDPNGNEERPWQQNATLIAHAPTDLAYLLGIADELRALIEAADSGEWHSSQDCKVEGRQGGADPCLLCAALAKARTILGIEMDDEDDDELDN